MYSRRQTKRTVWGAALRSIDGTRSPLTWWEMTIVVLFVLAIIGRLVEWLIGLF